MTNIQCDAFTPNLQVTSRHFDDQIGLPRYSWSAGFVAHITLGCMKTIVTARCILEPQVAAHAREMFAVLSDPAIYEFENDPPVSEHWLHERYRRLESRGPKDGAEKWLNWIIRVPTGEAVGFVQATVLHDGTSLVAYELNSHYWRQGIGSSAVLAMLAELQAQYGVQKCVAILKARNYRSLSLLLKLGFSQADQDQTTHYRDEQDEVVMVKALAAA